jgi:pyrimidine operon attenuation protein/uracil phosphoribosyltransferase
MQVILNHQQIQQKITRLAFQILENAFQEPKIVLAGIQGNGYVLAEKLAEVLRNQSDLEIQIVQITVNKEEPWSSPILLDIDEEKIKKDYIVLVDDVINSGKTMQYSLVKLLQQPTKAIKTVTLVDRQHRRYPIKADFVGLGLSTTLKNRVEIDFNDHNSQAFLR